LKGLQNLQTLLLQNCQDLSQGVNGAISCLSKLTLLDIQRSPKWKPTQDMAKLQLLKSFTAGQIEKFDPHTLEFISYLPNLTHLTIKDDVPISKEFLTHAVLLKKLKILSLITPLSATSFEALCSSLPKLEQLECHITKGLNPSIGFNSEAILKLDALKDFTIEADSLCKRDLEIVAQLKNLTRLHIRGDTPFLIHKSPDRPAPVIDIDDFACFKNGHLKQLDFSDSQISEDERARLRAELKLGVSHDIFK
jgi:hypothetical protein